MNTSAGWVPSAATHRQDIDGLRAIAVLLVVLYHAGFGFPGGFLGVDVFFVISGYLITGLLLQELAGGRISLGQFWLRRIRRILPASTALLLSVLLLGTCLLLPADLLELAASARAHLLFSANIFFWRNTGYFDGSVDLKPLLHFWSLAVEEQFYLLYPLYLIWFPPTRRPGKLLFFGIFLLCLAIGCYGHLRHPSAAFYLLPCRAWQLLLGGLLWLLPASTAGIAAIASGPGAGAVGLAAIIMSSFVPAADWSRWFPPGLIASSGAALVIRAGQFGSGPATRLLTLPLLRGIGLLSFSLYLWHWPLLSFLRHLELELQLPIGGAAWRLACLTLSCGLALASWKLVEQPIRRRQWFSADRRCLIAAISVTMLSFVCAETLNQFDGLPARFDSQVLRYASPSGGDARFRRSMSAADVQGGDIYACGPRESARRWLLLGDSHAMCLLPGLELQARQAGIRIDQLTRFATAPLLGFDHLAIWRNDGAPEFVEAAVQLAEQEPYERVILFAAWEGYLSWPTFPQALERTAAQLRQAGRKVVFVLPVPDQGLNVPLVLSGAVRSGRDPQAVGVPVSVREDRIKSLRQLLDSPALQGTAVVDPLPALRGPRGLVQAAADGEALYSDHQHLSPAGAARVAGAVFSEILGSLPE
jgi:peptidoglycan/LPS O-acetylase OafA/YrhL